LATIPSFIHQKSVQTKTPSKNGSLSSHRKGTSGKAVYALIACVLILSAITYYFTRPGQDVKEEPTLPEGTSPQVEVTSIAIYSDSGASETSVRALEAMFLWMNCSVALVDAGHINSLGLQGFDILCVPGGDMYQYSQDLSYRGKENIRGFVNGGGGYIGVCGGAYFASERVVWLGRQLPMTPLSLFPGTAEGPCDGIIPYPNYTVCRCNIVDHAHPITESEPEALWIAYCWGPLLRPNPGANVTVLGMYDAVNEPSFLAFEYGGGRVFLIGTHPEIEEDGDRDGTDWAEELDDRGSDWPFMRKVVLWLAG